MENVETTKNIGQAKIWAICGSYSGSKTFLFICSIHIHIDLVFDLVKLEIYSKYSLCGPKNGEYALLFSNEVPVFCWKRLQ